MTIVFDDENLYTTLKVEAARNHRPAKDIVSTALELYFEATREECDAILGRIRRSVDASPSTEPVDRPLEALALRR